jgi:hypothetical protein
LVYISSANPWRKRQSEGVTHDWEFGEKILPDWGEKARLEVKSGTVTARNQVFKGCRKKELLITAPSGGMAVSICGTALWCVVMNSKKHNARRVRREALCKSNI